PGRRGAGGGGVVGPPGCSPSVGGPQRARRLSYAVATWIIAGVMAARLLVQLPLYAAENIEALGAARIVMGIPLYAMGLWLAWLVSRPSTALDAEPGPQQAPQD
ncbi:MAG: DUF3159 domain-containing protein, partial [Micrococcaceae bacterium]|nr:DUF3159 domain-containing protein [Micrococcaceae bacterium]